MKPIKIVPVDMNAQSLLERLREELTRVFETHVIIEENQSIPQKSLDTYRNQYNSSEIIDDYASNTARGEYLYLLITAHDLYSGNLNFVFGQAQAGTGVGIISVARLTFNPRKELEKQSEKFFERVLKEAVHEIGHLVNLGHCNDPECVMHFSNSLPDTDRKSYQFCTDCINRMKGV